MNNLILHSNSNEPFVFFCRETKNKLQFDTLTNYIDYKIHYFLEYSLSYEHYNLFFNRINDEQHSKLSFREWINENYKISEDRQKLIKI